MSTAVVERSDVADELDLSDGGAPASQAEPVEREGFLVDPVTGEILGDALLYDSSPEPWQPESIQDVDRVLRRRLRWQRRVAALQDARDGAIREAVAEIEAEFAPGIEAAERRAAWYEVYRDAIRATIAAELEGTRERSLRVGRWLLGWKRKPVRIAVREGVETKLTWRSGEPAAHPPLLGWALAHLPEALKMSTEFQISKLPKGLPIAPEPAEGVSWAEATAATPEGALPAQFFEQVGGEDEFYIEDKGQ